MIDVTGNNTKCASQFQEEQKQHSRIKAFGHWMAERKAVFDVKTSKYKITEQHSCISVDHEGKTIEELYDEFRNEPVVIDFETFEEEYRRNRFKCDGQNLKILEYIMQCLNNRATTEGRSVDKIVINRYHRTIEIYPIPEKST